MKTKLLLLTLLFSLSALADVEVCSRKAQVAFGIFSHMWIKTEKVIAGMGGQIFDDAMIGDVMELPYITDVFVRDHSREVAKKCIVKKGVDEECVNDELVIGKPLGKWRVLNQCQTFVASVLDRCTSPEQKARNRAISKYKRLINESRHSKNFDFFKELEMRELMEKFQFTDEELN